MFIKSKYLRDTNLYITGAVEKNKKKFKILASQECNQMTT